MKRLSIISVLLLTFLIGTLVYLVGNSAFSGEKDTKVSCGGEYGSYQHSRDGTSVCAGGQYRSYQHSRDGSSVACGGLYGSYEHSGDGTSVCTGGLYSSYEQSKK